MHEAAYKYKCYMYNINYKLIIIPKYSVYKIYLITFNSNTRTYNNKHNIKY